MTTTLAEVETAIASRKSFKIKIDNPRMPLPNGFPAPIGYVLTGVECTAGVGGKYAVDGISQLELTFTHILALLDYAKDVKRNEANPDVEDE